MNPTHRLRPLLLAMTATLCLPGAHAAERAEAPSDSSSQSEASRPRIAEPEQARKALAALEDLLRAFEAGDTARIRQQLDPAMIGYQQLLDHIAQENNSCKQMRVHLLNTQVQAGPDVAVVQTAWEKRCLLLPGLTPQLTSGRSTILLHLGAKGWTLAAITAGNMLQRAAGAATRPVTAPAPAPPAPATGPARAPAPAPAPTSAPAPAPTTPAPAPAPVADPVAPAPTPAPTPPRTAPTPAPVPPRTVPVPAPPPAPTPAPLR